MQKRNSRALCIMAIAGLLLAGCPSAVNPPADKTALSAAIGSAISLKNGTAVGKSAGAVASGTQYVTGAQKAAINATIAVRDEAGATQQQVDAAAAALNSAVGTFTTARDAQTGTNTGSNQVDKTALTAAPRAGFRIDSLRVARLALHGSEPYRQQRLCLVGGSSELGDQGQYCP